ncbi:MAG TPA: hypothetical protein VF867_15235 [Arthrobacter sp.]
MSTNISHGYRLKPGIDPFTFVARLREVMDPARDTADAALLAGLYVKAIDTPWFRGAPIGDDAGWTAWRDWKKEQDALSPMERDLDPNEFGVQIGLDTATGRYLILLISYNEDLTDAFRAIEEVEEYGYWSSEEPPEGVTDADWAERQDAWARVIARPGYTNMLSFNLRPVYDGGVRRFLGIDGDDTAPVFASLPSDAERARDVGANAYSGYLAHEHGIDPMTAVQHVVFGRSAQLSLVTDVAAAYLPAITPELVTEGSHGAVIDPAYTEAMKAACAALFELDRERLQR